MNSHYPVNYLAKRQVVDFVNLCWNDLPEGYHNPDSLEVFDLYLHLTGFDGHRKKRNWTGYVLLAQVRRKAERMYRKLFAQDGHVPSDWAFFRFRLELALLETCAADNALILCCNRWADLLASLAYRLGQYEGRERNDLPLISNQAVLFVSSLNCRQLN